MRRYFLALYYPGSFVSETTTIEVTAQQYNDIAFASTCGKATKFGPRPYAFRYFAKESDGWLPQIVERGALHYLGGAVVHHDELEAARANSKCTVRVEMHRLNSRRAVRTIYDQLMALHDDDVVLALDFESEPQT